MAKKFGKFLMVTAVIGGAAAGIYYYLHKKDAEEEDFGLDDEDFDDFDDDLDDEDADRSYVDLGKSGADFKEGLDAAKAKASDKVVGEKDAKTDSEDFLDDDEGQDASMNAM